MSTCRGEVHKLLWAVLDRASAGWRGITYTPADVRHLQRLRGELGLARPLTQPADPDHNERPDDDVAAAA